MGRVLSWPDLRPVTVRSASLVLCRACLKSSEAMAGYGIRVQDRVARFLAAPALLGADPAVLVVIGMALSTPRRRPRTAPTRPHLRPGGLGAVLRLPAENAAGGSAYVGTVEAEADGSAHLDDVVLGHARVGARGTGLAYARHSSMHRASRSRSI